LDGEDHLPTGAVAGDQVCLLQHGQMRERRPAGGELLPANCGRRNALPLRPRRRTLGGDERRTVMKLAEALARRADLGKRITELRSRAVASAQCQDGDEPAENPTALLAEADDAAAELESLIALINRTNLATVVEPGLSVTEALARRDVLRLRHRFRVDLAQRGGDRTSRFLRSEIRLVSAVDVRALRSEADDLARRLRELDTRLQEVNWTTEVVA
jgi:hypothetical protein